MFNLPQAGSPCAFVTQVNSRQTSPLLGSDLVGTRVKLAADTLVASLLNAQGSLLVFTIVGLGGIRKTTLAQKIFNHHRVEAHFAKRFWSCVLSQNYSKTGLLKEIIRSAGGDYDRAETKVVSALAGNYRFLLVLDDVWRADVGTICYGFL